VADDQPRIERASLPLSPCCDATFEQLQQDGQAFACAECGRAYTLLQIERLDILGILKKSEER
jgi:hypothetical protein